MPNARISVLFKVSMLKRVQFYAPTDCISTKFELISIKRKSETRKKCVKLQFCLQMSSYVYTPSENGEL